MHPNGRRPLIYGVTADGRSGLVTNAMLSSMEDTMKSKAKRSTAKRATNPAASKKAQKPQAKQEAVPKRSLGKSAAIEAAARDGKLPEPPDFSAETHKRFRNKLASVVDLAKAGDLKGLRALEINPVSSSPKAIARYRDLCIVALEAQVPR